MNFKPTLWKTIVSIAIGVAWFTYDWGDFKCDSPGGCHQALYNILIYAVIIIIILYVIWSLIQKNKKFNKKKR